LRTNTVISEGGETAAVVDVEDDVLVVTLAVVLVDRTVVRVVVGRAVTVAPATSVVVIGLPPVKAVAAAKTRAATTTTPTPTIPASR
jgi:selenophosphate synthetase-related protein